MNEQGAPGDRSEPPTEPGELPGQTTYRIFVAGVQPSPFQEGKWNANSLLPEEQRLGSYDSEEEALERAERYTTLVVAVLKKSTTLRKHPDTALWVRRG